MPSEDPMPSTLHDCLPLLERCEASASSENNCAKHKLTDESMERSKTGNGHESFAEPTEVGSSFTMPLNDDDDDDNFEQDATSAKKQCRRKIRRKYPKERHLFALADEILAMIDLANDQHDN